MKQGMIGAVTALAAVVTYGVVTGAQAPAGGNQPPAYPPPATQKANVGDAPAYAFDIMKSENRLRAEELRRPTHPTASCASSTWVKHNLVWASSAADQPTRSLAIRVPVLWHDYTPEIYYITSGSGILTTGGVIPNQRPASGVLTR